MATKKISALTELTAPAGTEELIINDSGTSKKIQIDNIFNQDINVTGSVTATTIDATVLTGALPALDGSSLTGLSSFDPDGAVTINDSGADVDFRVEGSGAANALFVQGSDGNVGIGTASPLCKLHIENTSSNDGIRIINSTSGEGYLVFGDSEDTNIGSIAYDHTSDAMTFDVNNSERMRILAGGGITFNGDTATANALDDYEEGTFTPNIQPNSGSITWNTSADTLSYIKIGSTVHIFGRLQVASVSSPSGITRGIVPFTMKTLSDEAERAMGNCLVSGTTLNTQDAGIYPNAGGSYLEVIRTNATTIQRDLGNYLAAADYLDITFTYYAA